MPLVINSNIPSLNSQRQLVKSGMELDRAMERLSSGKRINKAADDAAGLAIANRQTSQIRGLDRAVANANDGVSLIQTAEGGLNETTNILQRMRELAIQSANGIYSDTDRATLDAEVQQMKAEIDRISQTTSFNGQNILDGSLGNIALQVGSEANQTIGIEIAATDIKTLGSGTGGDVIGTTMTYAQLILIDGSSAGSLVKINDQTVGSFTTNTALIDGNVSTGSLGSILDQINEKVADVEAAAFVEFTASATGSGILRGNDTVTIQFDAQDGTRTTYEVTDTGSLSEFTDKLSQVTGGVITATIDSDGKLIMNSDSAANLIVTDASGNLGYGTTANSQTAQLSLTATTADEVTITFTTSLATVVSQNEMTTGLGLNERTTAGDISGDLSASGTAFTDGQVVINGIEIGAATAGTTAAKVLAINAKSVETGVVAIAVNSGTGGALLAIKLDSVDGTEVSIEYTGTATLATLGGIAEANIAETAGKTISNVDISTAKGAQDSIDVIDGALETINSTRADLGAINNRLDFTVSNLMNVSEATSAARSRIMDADFAAETANLSRAQVLQQAAQAMLAQANAAPQQVLSLLR